MVSKALDRITVDPAVCQGQPAIRGMRITVPLIVKLVANGMSKSEVLEAYPELEDEDVAQALRYAALAASGRACLVPVKGG